MNEPDETYPNTPAREKALTGLAAVLAAATAEPADEVRDRVVDIVTEAIGCVARMYVPQEPSTTERVLPILTAFLPYIERAFGSAGAVASAAGVPMPPDVGLARMCPACCAIMPLGGYATHIVDAHGITTGGGSGIECAACGNTAPGVPAFVRHLTQCRGPAAATDAAAPTPPAPAVDPTDPTDHPT